MHRIASSRRNRVSWAGRVITEALERRQLLTAEVVEALPPVLSTSSTTPIDLSDFLDDSAGTGAFMIATFTFYSNSTLFGKTHESTVQVALTNNATPNTVANFLSYIDSGAYDNTFLHRSANLNTNAGGSPTAPATIVQGGGYVLNYSDPLRPTPVHINTNAPINDEYSSEILTEVAGTLAMAKTSFANSATSEFFFNSSDNTELDTPTTDSNGTATSYTVFGQIVGDGLNVIDQIAALPTVDINSTLSTVPVVGLSTTQAADNKTLIRPNNLVFVKSIAAQPAVTYSVTSSDPSLVRTSLSGSDLSFNYGGQGGTAVITVTATSYDGTTAQSSFTVTVPTSGETGGPVVSNSTPPAVSENTSAVLFPLANDTDGAASLNPATVTIVTQPTNGTATVDSSNGTITYVPNSGYTGPDSLSYTVADTAAAPTTSSAATITLDVVAAPVTVTIGTKTVRSLSYTQPDGTKVSLNVSGGTAVVTFAGSDVTTTTSRGVVTATGSGATISDISITNNKGQDASLNINAIGGTASIGGISDSGAMQNIIAPRASLAGNLTVGGLSLLELASTDHTVVNLGAGTGTVTLNISSAVDTSVESSGRINLIRSTSWTSDDSGYYVIAGASLGSLMVSGAFEENLLLSGPGMNLQNAQIGGQLGASNSIAWTLSGDAGTIRSASAASTWSLTATGTVASIHLGGNVSSAISASGIGSLSVVGNLTGATIQTTGTFVAGQTQFGQLIVGGQISGSTVESVGNIGSVSAAELTGSEIYAGVTSAVEQAAEFPGSLSDFSQEAQIGSVLLKSKTAAFTNSKIAGEKIGDMQLGEIVTSNGGNPQGLAAQTIRSVTAKLDSGGELKMGPAQFSSATTIAAYVAKKKLSLADFELNLIRS